MRSCRCCCREQGPCSTRWPREKGSCCLLFTHAASSAAAHGECAPGLVSTRLKGRFPGWRHGPAHRRIRVQAIGLIPRELWRRTGLPASPASLRLPSAEPQRWAVPGTRQSAATPSATPALAQSSSGAASLWASCLVSAQSEYALLASLFIAPCLFADFIWADFMWADFKMGKPGVPYFEPPTQP